MRRTTAGFTLLEVVVALAVGAMVLLAARGMMDGLGSQALATLRAATAIDAHANARDEFRQLVGDLVIGRDTVPGIAGDGEATTFSSWCEAPNGWTETCAVTVRVVRGPAGYRAIMITGQDTAILGDNLRTAAVRFLLSPSVGGAWVARWEHTIMLPVGVAVVMDGDTLLATVGDRQ